MKKQGSSYLSLIIIILVLIIIGSLTYYFVFHKKNTKKRISEEEDIDYVEDTDYEEDNTKKSSKAKDSDDDNDEYDVIYVNGKAHPPLDTLSVQDYSKNSDYVVIDKENPDPSKYNKLDGRLNRLKSGMWKDQPWQYYVILLKKSEFEYRAYAEKTGQYNLQLRVFTNRSGKNDSFYVHVGEGKQKQEHEWHTGMPRDWSWVSLKIRLQKGMNRLVIRSREPTAFSAIRIRQ